MEYIGFDREDDAFWYRNNNGGWLFITTDRTEFIWFSMKFTPKPILKHRATQGLSGLVTCARSLDEAIKQIAA